MYKTEQHIINKQHELYNEIDNLAWKSKNLYNAVNYVVRQNFFNYRNLSGVTSVLVSGSTFNIDPALVYYHITQQSGCTDKKYLNNVLIDKMLIQTNNRDYRALPSKISKQTLIQVNYDWVGFFTALKDYKVNPQKYLGCPKPPKYKEKTKGRNKIVYELGAISKPELRKGIIKLSGTNISIPFVNKTKKLVSVEIFKNNLSYTISVLYEDKELPLKTDNNRFIAIDLGINNLLTITNNFGERPVIINGKPLKSINQYYNKQLARFKSELPKDVFTSNKIKAFTDKRNFKLNYEIHNITHFLCEYCELHKIDKVFFGYNPLWKQDVNMSKKTNQNFVFIPYYKIIKQSKYKLFMKGIHCETNTEEYTSLCSALDNEDIGYHKKYLGKRLKRGLFRSADGTLINADVNGSFNHLRKAVPEFKVGNRGLAVSPIKITIGKNGKVIL